MKNMRKLVCIIIGVSFVLHIAACLTVNEHNPPKLIAAEIPQQEETALSGNSEQPEEEPIPPRILFAQTLQNLVNEQKWDEALALFDTLPEEDLYTPSIQNLKIAVLISMGKLAEAEKTAKMLEKQDPRNLNTLYTLTMIAQAKNDTKMRNTYLNKIIAIDPHNAQALQEQGLDLYTQGNYKAAGQKFSTILKKHPDNIDALIWLGKINYMLNALPEAEECYTIALKHEPDNSLAIAELARIKSETKRMAEAISDIKRAIELDPDEAHHWTDLGSYYLQIGRKPDSLAAFSRAIELIPDSYFVHIYLAGLHDDLGNKEKAIHHYTKVTELYPQYYFAYESLGVLLYEKQDWSGAENAFRSALQYMPENTHYALMTGLCAYKHNKKPEAKAFLQKYLKTIDKEKKELDYYLCRLFIDFAGDNDVYSRLAKEKDASAKMKKSFYLAAFYQLIDKWNIAEKYYIDIKVTSVPNFFEYRLALSELQNH
ncbi:MAG: tetratricopeptide repeat protein [Treponema sp.]